MQKLLNQEEIDAMFRAARRTAPAAERGPEVLPCDFRQAGQLTMEQVRSVSALHEGFARNLTHSLGAYLRVVFECNLVSVEQLPVGEVLSRVPDLCYVASLKVQPADVPGIAQLDLPLAFPIIDLLLGGEGNPEPEMRDVTDIEEDILQVVMSLICRELDSSWRAFGVSFAFGERQAPANLSRVMPPSETTLALTFEIRMGEVRGNLNVVIPGSVSNAFLRKLSQQWSYQRPRGSEETAARLRARLLSGRLGAQLAIAAVRVPARDLLALGPGQVLRLDHRVDAPLAVVVAGRNKFVAAVVQAQNRRAAQITGAAPEQSTAGGAA